MKKNIYFLGLLLLAACANDDEPTGQQVQNTYPLTIEVTETPMTGEEMGSSRAAITTTSSLNGFNMYYVYGTTPSSGSRTATKNGDGKWTGGSWPTDAGGGVMVNWYASTGGSFNLTEDANKLPYINFTVEENATSQKDLLVAKTHDTYANCSGNLIFAFHHACAALRFLVKKATNLETCTLKVSNIVLHNVIKKGKYYYGTESWTPSTESENIANYSLYTGSAFTLGSGSTDWKILNGTNGTSGSDPYLFIIPQTLTEWNGSAGTYIQFVWQCAGVGSGSGIARIPLSKVLEKGYKYDVKINIGTTTLTTYSVL